MSKQIIDYYFQNTEELLRDTREKCEEEILLAASIIADSFQNGNKVLICGNGGSAADSQHFAAEFVSSFAKGLGRGALPAIALTTDTSIITAFSNDYGFEGVFSRQIEALGRPGDILVTLSTSGNSKNCISAISQAKKNEMRTLSLTGKSGLIREISDFSISVPSLNTQLIQHCHIVIYHLLVDIVENILESGK